MAGFTMLIIYLFLLSYITITTTLSLDTITLGQSIKDREKLVSAGNVFELGFFRPGKSSGRYLGIWYKKDGEKTVVWVANRNTSISDSSGFLSINAQGSLVLRMNSTNNIVWSSNASTSLLQNPVAVLLESGNLVVKDKNDNNTDKFLWQSFDYPCDTLLSGMKLGKNLVTGMDWFLSSWKSMDDPAPGNFTYQVDPHGFPQIILRNGSEIIYRSGSWDGLGFTGTPLLLPNSVYTYNFVSNEKEVFYMFKLKNRSVPSKLAVTPSGDVQHFIWIEETQTWRRESVSAIDQCNNYSLCGSYASCNINKSPAVCECLEGFTPKSPGKWEILDWTEGCVRRAPLSCNHSDRFQKYAAVKLPDTSQSWVDKNISLVECEKFCLSSCSCMAYANSDVREEGSGCLLWFSDLLDIRNLYVNGQDLYVRVAASELDIVRRRHLSEKKREIIIVSCLVSAMGVLVLGWVIFMCKRKLRIQGKTDNIKDNSEESKKDDMELLMYDLNTIANATNNFADKNKLGEGGFGPVYKGTLMEGKEIAIKRLSKCSGQGFEEFKNEVILIARLQHRNLVKLLGCCTQRDERMLIYEYMPNKSLDYFIFDKTRRELLDWSKRNKIIGGIARGLLYLHQDSRLRIIHRDLKASNVLLDNEMNPKISDFGLAKTFRGDQTKGETNRVVGTYGYMSPEYAIDGVFSVKSDIFSFGVLVLEVVSGKRNRGFCHADHNHNLLGHAWRLWNDERAVELIDQLLDYSSTLSEILRCIHIGLLCVQQGPEDRPNMSNVALMLGGEGSLPQPRQPGFFTDRNLIKPEITINEITISLLEPR